jgi:hypothetical protein
MAALGLIAVVAICLGACGDDDEGDSSGADTSGVAVAPAPDDAFRDFSGALEAQGLVVTRLPSDALHGAETGREITGGKSGAALLFSTEDKAKAYAAEAEKAGDDKTTVVATVVFKAPTQADADFFADAYEGG